MPPELTPELLDYETTTGLKLDFEKLTEAVEAAACGQLLEWEVSFLRGPGCNHALAERLEEIRPTLIGPDLTPLDEVHRIIGPGPRPLIHEDPDSYYPCVERRVADIETGRLPSPLLAGGNPDWYALHDGNHTKTALLRCGLSTYWVIRIDHPEFDLGNLKR